MLHGKWKTYRSTGFGIVVTSLDGDLLAFGRGQPPQWCKTAAAAEAWALCSVVVQAPFVPKCRTDCSSLIATAAAGISKATEPRKLLAQIWVLIGSALDGDLQQLADGSTLVWVPAHTSPAAIGEAKKSDGGRLTHVEWRANRLADGLAKQAAATNQPLPAVLRLLVSAFAVVRHFAKLLGRVTHEANHFELVVHEEDGSSRTTTVRDSADKPKAQPKARPDKPAPLPPPPPAKQPRTVAPWEPPTGTRSSRSTAAAAHHRRAAEREEQQLQRRVAEVGAGLRAASSRTAGERLEALKERVRGK